MCILLLGTGCRRAALNVLLVVAAADCTKECLRTLEVELGVVKRFPDQNAAILGKVECRNVLRGRFLELEGRMRDPGRCNNHGGRLLQERERKFLEKLPRVSRLLFAS